MSKPKIYATCKAGCRWETVHKSDFDAAASFVKVPVKKTTELDVGPAYRIMYKEEITNQIYFVYIDSEGSTEKQFSIVNITEFPSYRPYSQIRICDAGVYIDNGAYHLQIIYELNGQLVEVDELTGYYPITIPEKPLRVFNAEEIYQYNDFGNLRLDVNISDFVSLNDIGYEEPVGVFDPVEFTYYCSNFKRGTVVKLTKQDVASGLYPKLYAFLETCPDSPKTDYYYDLEIVNNRDDDDYGCIRYIVKMVNGDNVDVCYEYTTQWTKVYPVINTIKAPLLVGDNLKGKTLYFDTSVSDPFELGTIEWDVSETILEIEQDNIYININGTQTVLYDGGWQVSSITFPTDKDYIVAALNGDGVDIVRTDKSQQDAYDTLLKKMKQTVDAEITQVLGGDY